MQKFFQVGYAVAIFIQYRIGRICWIQSGGNFHNIRNSIIIGVQIFIAADIDSTSCRAHSAVNIPVRRSFRFASVNTRGTGERITGASQLRGGRKIAGTKGAPIFLNTIVVGDQRAVGMIIYFSRNDGIGNDRCSVEAAAPAVRRTAVDDRDIGQIVTLRPIVCANVRVLDFRPVEVEKRVGDIENPICTAEVDGRCFQCAVCRESTVGNIQRGTFVDVDSAAVIPGII